MSPESDFRRHYRLIALDVDGTLVNHKGQIHPADREALQRAAHAGAVITVASGRMVVTIQPVFERIGLDGPIIAYNGAMVKLGPAAGRQTIFHQPVRSVSADSILDFVYWFNAHAPEPDQLTLNYYLDDTLYADRPSIWCDKYHKHTGSIYHYVGDLRQFRGREPTKLIVMSHPERREVFFQVLQYHLPGRIYLARVWPEYHLEIMDNGVNKGTAVLALARHLGILPAEVMTFGDAGNDAPMLRLEEVFGVAMGNASQEALDAADWVAPPCDDGGIAATIDRFFLPSRS